PAPPATQSFIRGCATPVDIDKFYEAAAAAASAGAAAAASAGVMTTGSAAAAPGGQAGEGQSCVSLLDKAMPTAAATAVKEDSLQWCVQQIQQVLQQHPAAAAAAAKLRGNRPMLHQAMYAHAAAEARGWAPGGGPPTGPSGGPSPPRDALGRWMDVEMAPPPQQLEEVLVVLAAAVKVYVVELIAAAEQLEALEFEQCGPLLGPMQTSSEGTPSKALKNSQPEEPLPMRVLLPNHVLEAAKSLQLL
ncbi:uncharacterized protein LOC34624183, partial [Cyclospora cayetanensis]|uniref:Uncharacterized protein LOC34624183 n=1 Tax=Cyclospora cayetanensis TaxID=88456 RepID=A0A6P6S0X2_9EIME